MSNSDTDIEVGLSAPHVLDYDYRRSLGPVLSRFFTGLRAGTIHGIKTRSGRVLVPPAEYDPETGEATTDEFVEVGPGGVVETWAWVETPRASHPLSHPFAFALIKLDGADTAMLHAVDAGEASAMKSGMRVTPRWAAESQGSIKDLSHFVPESEGSAAAPEAPADPTTDIVTPVHVEYTYTPGKAASRYLRGLKQGKILGQASDSSGLVYVPPRGACPRDGVPTSREVEVSSKGTVVALTIVRVPSENIKVDLPYCTANILLDGADQSFTGLLQECSLEDVRIGMRVEAVWRDASEWDYSSENIKHFRPIDEPDLPFEDIKEYC
ncbi:MAG: DNA-binding protein [Spirochaeta sp.]|nr:DNA-binding protein [Spirochaeta sp.]RPG03896.1 MAG: DNA-binding protein [Proteobacteria bacterium TMED72]